MKYRLEIIFDSFPDLNTLDFSLFLFFLKKRFLLKESHNYGVRHIIRWIRGNAIEAQLRQPVAATPNTEP